MQSNNSFALICKEMASSTTTTTEFADHEGRRFVVPNVYSLNSDQIGLGLTEQVTPLRERRNKRGYMDENGTDNERGKKGDESALFGEKWLVEFVRRRQLLENDLFYRFANLIAGMVGSPIERFVQESVLQEQAAARVRQAIRDAERETERVRASESGNPSIDSQRKLVEQSNNSRDELTALVLEAENSQACFVETLRSQEYLKKAAFIIDLDTNPDRISIFNLLTCGAIALTGEPMEFLRSEQKLQTIAVSLANLVTVGSSEASRIKARRVQNDLPYSSRVAFAQALLFHAKSADDILSHVSERRLFVESSEYAKAPHAYIRDLVTLSALLQEGTDSPLLYDNISFLLYAHLNKMRRFAGIADIPEMLRPVFQRSRTKRALDQRDIVFDLLEDDLESLAQTGEAATRIVAPEDLRRLQSQLAPNGSVAITLRLVDALLYPFLMAAIPYVFYTFDPYTVDVGRQMAAFAGGDFETEPVRRYDGATFVSSVLMQTFLILARAADFDSDRDPASIVREKAAEIYNVSPIQWKNYRERALTRLLVASGALRCAAQYVAVRSELGAPLDIVSGEKARAMAAYASTTTLPGSTKDNANSEKESAALFVFANSYLRADDELSEPQALATPSQRMFYYAILDRNWLKTIQTRQTKLQREAQLAQNRLTDLEKLRDDRLAARQVDFQAEVYKRLQEESIPSATSALSPLNSGMLFFTEVFFAAVQDAFNDIKLYFRCLAAQFHSEDELIASDEMYISFGKFVAAKIREQRTRFPTLYTALAIEDRAIAQRAVAMQGLRDAFRRIGGRHGRYCECPTGSREQGYMRYRKPDISPEF